MYEHSLTVLTVAVLVLGARVGDFLLGRRGNRWLKEHLIFRPWYHLEGIRPLSQVRLAAALFANAAQSVFGEQMISERAYFVSLIIGVFGIMDLSYLTIIHRFAVPVQMVGVSTRGFVAVFVVLGIINPIFDLVSFAITRFLAVRIRDSGSLIVALTAWILDVLSACLISALTFVVTERLVRLNCAIRGS